MRSLTRKVLIPAILVTYGLAAFALTKGGREYRVSLDSVAAIWADFIRDVDNVGLFATRVSSAQEIEIGNAMLPSYPIVAGTPLARYVSEVGQHVAEQAKRRDLTYQFHIIDSDVVNAFAIPGGHVFINSGMLHLVKTEAELASVLGHEIAHIDLKHCIERLQYETQLRHVVGNLAQIATLAHGLVSVAYSKEQENEADRTGMLLMAKAGYAPIEAVAMFLSAHETLDSSTIIQKQAAGPAEEVAGAIGALLTTYFETHPPWLDRAEAVQQLLDANEATFAGKRFCVGRSNFKDMVPCFRDRREGELESVSRQSSLYSLQRGILAEAQGETLEAARWYADAVQSYQDAAARGDAGAQFTLGFMYANGRGVVKDQSAAETWYRRSAEQGDQRAKTELAALYYSRARERHGKNLLDLALADYQASLALDPKNPDGLYYAAKILRLNHRLPEALASINQAFEQREPWPDGLNVRGLIKRDQRDIDGAIADYSAAIEADSGWALPYYNRGQMRRVKRDFEGAQADFEWASSLDLKDQDSRRSLAEILLLQGRAQQAIATIGAAVEADPQAPGLRNWQGRLLLYAGQPGEAAKQFSMTLQTASERQYAALWLYLARLNEGKEAILELSDVANTVDLDSWPGPILAYFLGSKSLEQAEAMAKSGRDPTETTERQCELAFYLGAAHAARGEREGAREKLANALEICPLSFVEFDGAQLEMARLDGTLMRLDRSRN
jgi:Zn-dependent protease with chaperone function/lipoprotein NlpI